MRSDKNCYISLLILMFGIFVFQQDVFGQKALSVQDEKIKSEFEKEAKDYSNLRERLEDELPKLPKEASAEQIENHKISFQTSVRNARSDAKQGDIFNPSAAQLIRKIIKEEFQGKERVDLRKTVFEAETQGVPIKINFSYPQSKEKVEMPPTLLLKLPQLPKQLRYRFVGQNLLLVDRENGLIIDFMTNALP